MEKAKVSKEIARLLDKQLKDNWNKQFNLINHCKAFSGNGILCKEIYVDEFKPLQKLSPIEYARCMIIGYEVIE